MDYRVELFRRLIEERPAVLVMYEAGKEVDTWSVRRGSAVASYQVSRRDTLDSRNLLGAERLASWVASALLDRLDAAER